MAETSPGSAPSNNRNVMVVLSYLWLLALVPLLTEKNDKEVQWHAKHGIVMPLLALAQLGLHLMCMLKGINGGRLLIPGLSEFADKF